MYLIPVCYVHYLDLNADRVYRIVLIVLLLTVIFLV